MASEEGSMQMMSLFFINLTQLSFPFLFADSWAVFSLTFVHRPGDLEVQKTCKSRGTEVQR